MENSSMYVGVQYHVRSISLPSSSHPNIVNIENKINKLKSENISSSTSIQNGLVGLAELYNAIEELIHSQHTQHALLQCQNGVLVEDALEASIGLLDSCSALKEVLNLMKENVLNLQSALRTKGGDSRIESHIAVYFSSRKKAKKEISKCLRALKQTENRTGSSPLLDADHYLLMVVRILGEVSKITICVFRSVLPFLSAACLKTKYNAWPLISKLMMKNSTLSEEHQGIDVNEVVSVDLALYSLHSKDDVAMAQRRLQKLDDVLVCVDGGVDCLFRQLIQSRSSLLNILAN